MKPQPKPVKRRKPRRWRISIEHRPGADRDGWETLWGDREVVEAWAVAHPYRVEIVEVVEVLPRKKGAPKR